jgi:hypothetical protein
MRMAPGGATAKTVAHPEPFFYLTINVTFPYLLGVQLEMAARLHAGAGSDAGYNPVENGENLPVLKGEEMIY